MYANPDHMDSSSPRQTTEQAQKALTMQENSPEGEKTQHLGGCVASSPTPTTTVVVSTDSHPLAFVTGSEILDVEADAILSVRDLMEWRA